MTETEAPAQRGRPRPAATIERDAKVFEFIKAQEAGATREQIVTGTELPGNQVYLSLYRLRAVTKQVVREGNVWKAVPEAA